MLNSIFVKQMFIIELSIHLVKRWETLDFGIDNESKVLVVNSCRLEIIWVLDSYCSFHMTPLRHWFSDLKEVDSDKILLGDGDEC